MLPTFSVCGEHNQFTRVSGLTIRHDNGRFDHFSTEGRRNFKLDPNIATVKLGTDGCFFSTSIDAFFSYFCPLVLSFGNNFGFFTSTESCFGIIWSSPIHITISSIGVIGSLFSFWRSSVFQTLFVDFCRLERFQRLNFDGYHIARHDFFGVGRPYLKGKIPTRCCGCSSPVGCITKVQPRDLAGQVSSFDICCETWFCFFRSWSGILDIISDEVWIIWITNRTTTTTFARSFSCHYWLFHYWRFNPSRKGVTTRSLYFNVHILRFRCWGWGLWFRSGC